MSHLSSSLQVMEEQPYIKDLVQTTPAFPQQEPTGQFAIDEEGIIHSVNEELMTLFGYDKEELIGKNINILTPQKCHERRAKFLKTYLKSNKSKQVPALITSGQRKDGTKLPLQLGINILEIDNRQLIIGNLLNRTRHQEKEYMSKLIAREVLSKTGAERIHTATHHLRTILDNSDVYFSVYQNETKQEIEVRSINGKETNTKMIYDTPYTSTPDESYTYYPDNAPHINDNASLSPTQSYLSTRIKNKDNQYIGFLTATNKEPTRFSAFQIDTFLYIAPLLALDYQQLICNKEQTEALFVLTNKNKILNYWHNISEIEKNTGSIEGFLNAVAAHMPKAFIHDDKVNVNIELFNKQHNPQYNDTEKQIYSQNIDINGKYHGCISISHKNNTPQEPIILTVNEKDLISDTAKRINSYVQLYRAKQAYIEETDMLNRSGLIVFKCSSNNYENIKFTSPHIAHLFEYSLKEFKGGEFQYSDFIHPDDKDKILNLLEEKIQDPKVCHFENPPYRIITKNNTIKWVNHPVCIIRDRQNKKAIYLKGLICDNTIESDLTEEINKLTQEIVELKTDKANLKKDIANSKIAFTKHFEAVKQSLDTIINYSTSLTSTLITNTELAQQELEHTESTEPQEKPNLSEAWNYERIDEIIKTIYQLKKTVTHKLKQPLKKYINKKTIAKK